MNLVVVGRFLLGASELTGTIFVCNGRNCSNHTDNLRCRRTKFSRPDDQTPGVCARLITDIMRKNNDPEMALTLCTIWKSDMSPVCDYTIFQTYT